MLFLCCGSDMDNQTHKDADEKSRSFWIHGEEKRTKTYPVRIRSYSYICITVT